MDIRIEETGAEAAQGTDRQLEAAIEWIKGQAAGPSPSGKVFHH